MMNFVKTFICGIMIATMMVLSGCKSQIPSCFIIPESIVSGDNRPIIFDYVWLNECVECQLSDASRWIRRNIELERMGDSYKATIVCVLAVSHKSDSAIVSSQNFLSKSYPNVHYFYQDSDISAFFPNNTTRLPRYSFTCIIRADGSLIYEGGNPKKDMDSFRQYTELISNINININQ